MLRSLIVLLLVTLATTVEAGYNPYSSAAFLSPASYLGNGYGYTGVGAAGLAGVGVAGVGYAGAFPAVHGHSAASAGREQPNLMLTCRTQSMEVIIEERRGDSHSNAFGAFSSFFAKPQQRGLNVSIEFTMPRGFEYEVKELNLMVVEYGQMLPGESPFCNGRNFGPGLSPKKKKNGGVAGINAFNSLGYAAGLGYAAPAAVASPVGLGYPGVASFPFAVSHSKVGAAANRRQQGDGHLATIENPGYNTRQLVHIESLPEFRTLEELAGRVVLACPERPSVGYGGQAECRSEVMPDCCTLGFETVTHSY